MSLPFTSKPGQVILFEAGKFDPVGHFIITQERDTPICHAAMMCQYGRIWTTGARELRFGLVDAETYLKGRTFHVAEWDSTITDRQIRKMLATCMGFSGQLYGFGSVGLLMARGLLPGVIRQLYPWPTMPEKIHNPFCSESVAAACWMAGIKVCSANSVGELWKKEPSAVTPVNLYQWANQKETPLNLLPEGKFSL